MTEIVTRGSGEYEAVADQAELRLSFAATDRDRPRALNLLAGRMALVDPTLQRDGVTVRQRSLHVGDRWEGKRRSGASAQQQLVLRVDDLTLLDDLMAALFSAEPEWFDGPHWTLADETAAVREAQRRAVADAQARAEAYADALGVRLGPLLRLADEGAERPYPMARGGGGMVAFAAGDVSRESVQQLGLVPEQVTARATCVATWQIL